MKAMAASSMMSIKAIPTMKLIWILPAVAITALFASKSSVLHNKHVECSTRLNYLTQENLEFEKMIEDGTLLAKLTGASFKIDVSDDNKDILRMTPKAMAKQIQQLREILKKYNTANKRLMAEKDALSLAKDKALDSLSKQSRVFNTTKQGQSECESKLREASRELSKAKDELELSKTEQMSSSSRLDETKDQLKNSDSLLDAAAKELKATRTKLNAALEEQQRCFQQHLQQPTHDSSTGGSLAVAGDRSFQGYRCEATEEDMKRYLSYTPKSSCPNDWYFVQRLIFKKNCFALPRRKCRVPTPGRPADPLPLPQSLFDQKSLKNRNLRWDLHQYKSFEELNSRTAGDCRNCFNLSLEATRWQVPFRGTIPMKDVVEMKKGTLRTGLDVGGGTGSFAAHMAKFGVTVMTTAFNVETISLKKAGLPYMETIAARGLIPLHAPHASRLPLFDGVLDLVHSVNSIKYIPIGEFEELIYEWDRVLRVGGILWFEMFYAPVSEMVRYVAVIEHLKYKKLYWNFSEKPEAGEVKGAHVYLNCVLEKQPAPGRQILVGPPQEDMENIV